MTGVIDPGVGSARRAIAVELENSFLVGPDNGLFELVLRNHPPERIVEVSNTDYFLEEVSSTFHGRDIFSPVAAYIADGLDIAELGPAVDPDEEGEEK